MGKRPKAVWCQLFARRKVSVLGNEVKCVLNEHLKPSVIESANHYVLN